MEPPAEALAVAIEDALPGWVVRVGGACGEQVRAMSPTLR